MCALNGILRLTPEAPPVDAAELAATRDAMATRGPDGSGLWLSPSGLMGLGHRRLAIIDLSPTGAQPMHSADGRYTIVFNGEIYNYRELRARLASSGHAFRSQSDTEVLLALYACQGMAMLAELRGMYAFALWDERERRLVLARDHAGIKPLYYTTDGRTLRFASQVKALDAGGALPRDVDPAGLAGFLLWGSVPEPLTIRKGVRAVPAAHWLEIVDGRVGEPRPHPARPATEAVSVPAAIEDSIVSHLVADVPVGVFLSAGLDSALLAAVAQRHLDTPLRTFTLAFDEFRGTALDEAPGAAEIARLLGTEHTERHVSRIEIEKLWPRALEAMDQPSIDGFNVYLVSHYAHEAGLKVALSGLGGDELFGTYPSFRDVPRWAAWARFGRRVPGLQSLWPHLRPVWGNRPKLAGLLRYGGTLPGAYFLRRGLFLPEEVEALLGADTAREAFAAYSPLDDVARHIAERPPDEWAGVQRLESRHYLRNQLLRDADWASLAHSLELRVPFVDVRLEAALLASRFEPARSHGKAALVRQLAPELPEAVIGRAKSGFMVPVGPAGPAARNWGRQSRHVAHLALRAFGVELQAPRPARGGTMFLLTEAFHSPGGIQTYNRDQVQALRQCAPDEALTLLVLNDSPGEVRQPEWSGFAAEGLDRRKWRFAWRVTRQAFAQRPERVLIGHRNFLALAPLVGLVSPGTERWLLTYGIDAQPRLRVHERLLLRAVERVFAISPQTAASFRRAGCRHEIELWPCSLPFSWTLPEVVPPRLVPPYRLLTVSRLAPPERYKGIDDSIRAVGRLVRDGLDVTLDVVGQGDDLGRLRELAHSEGVESRVAFQGLVSAQALRHFYERSDLFVLPSGAEGFGIVFLEAFAFGRPVVAADAGGTPFVVRPGESGWLVPYGDPAALAACLAERLTEPEETRRVALAGRRLVEGEFSFAQAVSRARALLADSRSVRGGIQSRGDSLGP